jgi:hypothetical protein
MTGKTAVMNLLSSQGGGHGNIRSVGSSRPLIAKPFNARESAFYAGIQQFPLEAALPKFHGIHSANGTKWLLLEDLTHGLRSPCVADFKLGTRSFELGVPLQKQLRQLSHTIRTTTRTHAVRLIDVCLREQSTVVDRWNRREGRRLSPHELQLVVHAFLPAPHRGRFLAEIDRITGSLSETYGRLPNLRLYSTSLVVAYDGDAAAVPLRAALIDFAHGYLDISAEGVDTADDQFDDNALAGLASLRAFAATEPIGPVSPLSGRCPG